MKENRIKLLQYLIKEKKLLNNEQETNKLIEKLIKKITNTKNNKNDKT